MSERRQIKLTHWRNKDGHHINLQTPYDPRYYQSESKELEIGPHDGPKLSVRLHGGHWWKHDGTKSDEELPWVIAYMEIEKFPVETVLLVEEF